MDVDRQEQQQKQQIQEPQQHQTLPADSANTTTSHSTSTTTSHPRSAGLPVSRIKTIMKTCPDTSMISQEAAVVVTKSTVSF